MITDDMTVEEKIQDLWLKGQSPESIAVLLRGEGVNIDQVNAELNRWVPKWHRQTMARRNPSRWHGRPWPVDAGWEE